MRLPQVRSFPEFTQNPGGSQSFLVPLLVSLHRATNSPCQRVLFSLFPKSKGSIFSPETTTKGVSIFSRFHQASREMKGGSQCVRPEVKLCFLKSSDSRQEGPSLREPLWAASFSITPSASCSRGCPWAGDGSGTGHLISGKESVDSAGHLTSPVGAARLCPRGQPSLPFAGYSSFHVFLSC